MAASTFFRITAPAIKYPTISNSSRTAAIESNILMNLGHTGVPFVFVGIGSCLYMMEVLNINKISSKSIQKAGHEPIPLFLQVFLHFGVKPCAQWHQWQAKIVADQLLFGHGGLYTRGIIFREHDIITRYEAVI